MLSPDPAVCSHEAGHVVAACAISHGIDHAAVGCLASPGLAGEVVVTPATHRDSVQVQLVILACGPLAEVALHGTLPDDAWSSWASSMAPDGDWVQFCRVARTLPPAQQAEARREALVTAERFVRRHRDAIVTVRDALASRWYLTGDDVDRLLADVPRVRGPAPTPPRPPAPALPASWMDAHDDDDDLDDDPPTPSVADLILDWTQAHLTARAGPSAPTTRH